MKPQPHLRALRRLSLKEDKIKGYAGNPQKFFDPFLQRFKVIVYRKGSYLVIDRYSGDEEYIGQAITFYRKRPIYGLNYYGKLMGREERDVRAVYEFLKHALRAGAGKSRHRGLNGFNEAKWLYKNTYKETRGFVEGEECIFYGKKIVYRGVYHGGAIEDSRGFKEWARKMLPVSELKKAVKF